jgi:small subunit ribosomal protein S13
MAGKKAKDVDEEKVKEEKKESKEEVKEVAEKKPERREERKFKELVRILNTDLDGTRPIIVGLTYIKGISNTMSKAVCTLSGIETNRRLSSLKEDEIAKIEKIIKDPLAAGMPRWMVNRRNDRATGKDMHFSGSDVDVATRFDVQRMVDLKTYKGVRHMLGLPVRGQRTRSSFRKGRSVGVVRKAVRMLTEGKKEEKK